MVPLQRVLPSVLIDLVRRQPVSPEKVDFSWRTAVGAAVARASSVRLDGNGTLHVSAADPRWRREIERSLHLVRARLETLLGDSLTAVVIESSDADL